MKKFVAMLLIFLLAFSIFTGCEKNSSEKTKSDTVDIFEKLQNDNLPQIEGDAYNKKGTGDKKPDNYSPSVFRYKAYLPVEDNKITCLQNEELQNSINTFIQESIDALSTKWNDFRVYVTEKNKEDKDIIPSVTGMIEAKDTIQDLLDKYTTNVDVTCINNYLSVVVSLEYLWQEDFRTGIYDCKTAVYTLDDGKRVEDFSELFFKDTAFSENLNLGLARAFYYHTIKGETTKLFKLKGNFKNLVGNIENFTADEILFTNENPYFYDGKSVQTTALLADIYSISPVYKPVDPTQYFTDKVSVEQEMNTLDLSGDLLESQNCSTYLLPETELITKEAREKINKEILSWSNKNSEEMKALSSISEEDSSSYFIKTEIYNNKFVVCSMYTNIFSKYYCRIFDAKTGNDLWFNDIFGDGWEKIAEVRKFKDNLADKSIKNKYYIADFILSKDFDSESQISFALFNKDSKETFRVTVPVKELNW